MPNPLTTGDAPDLTDKSIKRVFIKNMAHKHEYTKEELAELKKKGAKPGTKKAHSALAGKKKRISTDGGYMLS